MISRPLPNEFNPHFKGYIELVPDGDLIDILKQQHEKTTNFFKSLSKEQSEYRYAEGKWNLKEVLGHLCDTERVMSYRLLVIARGDKTPLPSFDENAYNLNADFNHLELDQIISEFSSVRLSTLSQLSILSEHTFQNLGTVYNTPTTARAIAFIIAGHELHHLKIINERYL